MCSLHDWCSISGYCAADRIVRFRRYVDDVIGAIAYDVRSSASLRAAHHIVSLLELSYSPMILKAEPTEGWFPFLEALVRFTSDGTINVRFHNKNYKSITTKGVPKFLTIQDRLSFQSREMAITKIIGALHRLRRTSDHIPFMILDIAEMFVVYNNIGYSCAEFCSALTRLHRKTGDRIWELMKPIIASIRPSC